MLGVRQAGVLPVCSWRLLRSVKCCLTRLKHDRAG